MELIRKDEMIMRMYVQGYSVDEIAEEMETDESDVRYIIDYMIFEGN